MTLANLPILTGLVFSLGRAHPPYPPCACASDARRGWFGRARARATARATEVYEQPSDPRAKGSRVPRVIGQDARAGREEVSKRGSLGSSIRGCRVSTCKVPRPGVRSAIAVDARYEGSMVQRVHGDGTQPTRLMPCNPSTLATSMRGNQVCANAQRRGVAARVGHVRDVLAHVASLVASLPTLPTTRPTRRGPNGRVCQSGRHPPPAIGTPGASRPEMAVGTGTVGDRVCFVKEKPPHPHKETGNADAN